MATLIEYAKEQGASSIKKINGPNGAFITMKIGDEDITLPIGGKSQEGKLSEYNILITDDGQAIATVNLYEEEESLVLE